MSGKRAKIIRLETARVMRMEKSCPFELKEPPANKIGFKDEFKGTCSHTLANAGPYRRLYRAMKRYHVNHN